MVLGFTFLSHVERESPHVLCFVVFFLPVFSVYPCFIHYFFLVYYSFSTLTPVCLKTKPFLCLLHL